MRVRDLGPLLVEVDGREKPVVGTKGSSMLALLTIHVNEQVSVGALTDAAWGERVSAGAASTLLSHVWRLRQLLEPHRRSGDAPQVLVNDAGGYRLIGTTATLDSLFFADSAGRVRDHLAAGRLDDALSGADAALCRWRGRPYGPAADAGWAAPAVARLEELRSQLQERRVVALIGLGALDIALSDLQPLIAAMPFHETLRGLQMEALHRSGRTEQALEAFSDARRTLVDEVGIEPGRDLQQLHRRILDDDPALAGPRPVLRAPRSAPVEAAAALAAVAGPFPVDVHLPPTPTVLIGRSDELTQLRGLLADHQLVTISGPAGSGKTRIAVEVARTAAADFPDGVWLVDLVGVDDPDLVVDVVISTIGFVPSADSTPTQDLTAYLTTRTVLLVLDNCEHLLKAVAELVGQVLGDPSRPTRCKVLATSRERLGVPGEVGWTLEPLALPAAVEAGDRADAAAVRLLLQRLREADPGLVLDSSALDDVVNICVALDGLPLPLELAAARAPVFSLSEIAQQVSTNPGRLRRPGHLAHDHRATLRSTIDWSYDLLGERERAAHRRLSALPGPFSSAAASAVLDAELDETDDILVELVLRSMLARVPTTAAGRPTTFRQLVTVRDHARHVLRSTGSSQDPEGRRDIFVAALIAERPPLGTAAEPAWNTTIDDDQAAVRATLARLLIERPDPGGARLAPSLINYWYHRGRLTEATRWLTLAHGLLHDDRYDLTIAGGALASTLTLQGRHQQARPYVDAILTFSPDLEDPRLDGLLEVLVGLAGTAYISGHHQLIVELYPHLRQLGSHTRTAHLPLLIDGIEVLALAAGGQLEEGVAKASDVHRRAVELHVPMATWLCSGAGMALGVLGNRPELGTTWSERCMDTHFRFGTGAGGAFIETRANLAALQGDHRLAARLYGAAYGTTRRVGMHWPFRELTHELIARTKDGLDETTFNQLWHAGRVLTPLQVLHGLRAGFTA